MNADWLYAGACEQARAIVRGEIDALELLSAQYAEIERRNPDIRAYLSVAPATAEPVLAQSPLAGTSFAVKDNFDVGGLPTAAGLRAMAFMPERDSKLVARLRAGGMHCLGKLNMHPMALGASNHNPDYGDCFHPFRAGYTAGGSSGGSAAAVAAGLCGIALGTDTMGSVRLPAAYCGVVGFKPSHESLGLDGIVPLSRILDHAGILARRVEDVQAAMGLLAPHLNDSGLVGTPSARWRVGWVINAQEHGAEAPVMVAYDAAMERLSAHRNIDFVPVQMQAVDPGAVRRAGLLLCEAELQPLLAHLVEDRPEALPPDLLGMMRYITRQSAVVLGRAVSNIAQAAESLDSMTQGFDALLLPTTPQTAFPMNAPVPPNQADFTALANMSGAPAISLPLPVERTQLAVGLQLVGHRGHDHALLMLARELERSLGQR